MTNVSLSLYFMPVILARFTSQLPSLSEGCAPTNSDESRRFQSDSQRRGKDYAVYLEWPRAGIHTRWDETSRVESSRVTSSTESWWLNFHFRQSDSSDRCDGCYFPFRNESRKIESFSSGPPGGSHGEHRDRKYRQPLVRIPQGMS